MGTPFSFIASICVITNIHSRPSHGFSSLYVGRFGSLRSRSSQSHLTCLSMETKDFKRVVVTGMGIASCLGNDLEEVTSSLHNSKSGITHCQEFADVGLKSHVRGKPNLTTEEIASVIPQDYLSYCGDGVNYAYYCMVRAIEDAGLEPKEYRRNPRVAAIIGQSGPSVPDVIAAVDAVREGNAEGIDWAEEVGPYCAMKTIGSSASAVLSTAFEIGGPSFSIASACSTGAHCIGVSFNKIQTGKVDLAFCGAGDDSACWQYAAMFDAMGVLSSKYNDNPTIASRPYDIDRDGFVVSAGGGIIVLEELEHAKKRGAKIYAEIVGYGATADGYDMVAPSGVGGQRCMKLAIDEAMTIGGDKPVEYINTHGTSTPVGDGVELTAIKTLVSEEGYEQLPYVGSTKSLSGHALGAAGIHEAIYTILMMNNDFMAKSANIDTLMEESSGMNILTSRVDKPFRRAISNSFGFGGTNCVIVFDKYEE